MTRRRLIAAVVAMLSLCFAIDDLATATVKNDPCPAVCSCLGNVVDCSRKKLSNLPENLPAWTEILDVSSNNLFNISSDELTQERLQEINLNDNGMTELDWNLFERLPRLQIIKAAHNKLERLSDTNHTVNVTHIIMNHNAITSIDPSLFGRLLNLRVLDLNLNLITSLKNGTFTQLNNLRHLFLADNKIVDLERGSFDYLPSLQWLDLSRNGITSLQPNIFSRLNRLESLELSRNKLRRIEGLRFQGLASLLSLRLRRNGLTELMDGAFWGLSNIRNLQLDYNNLTKISNGFLFGLESLKSLSISHNKITSITHESWLHCKQLRILDLSHNQIASISEHTLVRLNAVEKLSLNHNKISYISDYAFRDLKALRVLILSNNDIASTSEVSSATFVGLISLTRLFLDNNRIKSITKRTFNGLNQLRQLQLTNNSISSIDVDSFESLRSLRHLRFNSSSMLCDCRLSWLPDWLRKRGYLASAAVCLHPPSLQGRNILDVKLDKFQCDEKYAKPMIIVDPVSHVALKDGTLNLTCTAITSSSSSTFIIQWKKDNMALSPAVAQMTSTKSSTDKNLTEYTSFLVIKPVKDDHAGRYQCLASHALGTAYSSVAEVTVSVFPSFLKIPLDVTVKVGTIARLECAATGYPQPEIAWQKDGGYDFPAARERRMHVMTSDDVFLIVDVKREDQGVYTCSAKNDAGILRANTTLTVLQAPSFVKIIQDKEAIAGQTTVLECMSSHLTNTLSRATRLEWLKDGQPLTLSERHHFAAESQLLVITSTQPSDAGEYTCIVTNTLGSERATSRFVVLQLSNNKLVPFSAGNREVQASDTSSETTRSGVIVIAVVVCIVGTSLIWVIVICCFRRMGRNEDCRSIAVTNVSTIVPKDRPTTLVLGSVIDEFGHFMQRSPLLRTKTGARVSSFYSPDSVISPHSYTTVESGHLCRDCHCLDSGCFCNELRDGAVTPSEEDEAGSNKPRLSVSTNCTHKSDYDHTRGSSSSLPSPRRQTALDCTFIPTSPWSTSRKNTRNEPPWLTASHSKLAAYDKNCCTDKVCSKYPSSLSSKNSQDMQTNSDSCGNHKRC